MMKKLVALLLGLVLVCTAASALAAAATNVPTTSDKVEYKYPTIESVTVEGNTVTVKLSESVDLKYDWVDDENSVDSYVYIKYYDSIADQEYNWWNESTSGDTVTFELQDWEEFTGFAVVGNYTYDDGAYSGYRMTTNGDGYFSYNEGGYHYYAEFENGKATYYQVVETTSEESRLVYYVEFDETGAMDHFYGQYEDGKWGAFDGDGNATYLEYFDEENDKYYWWDDEDGWQTWDENGELVILDEAPEGAPDPDSVKAPYFKRALDKIWYGNNTVGVLGLSLRDDLGMTDKWYNVVPVDLTVEGTQTIPMVASNIYYFGSAKVTVADGNVTVTYTMPRGHAYLKEECLQWFTSLDDITADFLAAPAGEYAFGEPVSISEQLNGQDIALLFICNHVTYRQPINDNGGALTRYYNTQERWQNWRAALTELLDNMKTVEAEAATDTDVDAAAATETDAAAATETDAAEEAEAEAAEAEAAEVEAAEVEAAEEADAAEAEAEAKTE